MDARLTRDAGTGRPLVVRPARTNARGVGTWRRAAILPRSLAYLLPALLVFISETVRHEYLHGDIPLMVGNVITGAIALAISLAILVPLYRRLDASDARVRRLEIAQAVADERARIASELHDGISQALFFLNVEAGTVERSLTESGESDTALRAVRDIEQAVREMAQRVRDTIFDLRTERAPDQPFGDWLKTYARRWSEVHNVAVTIEEAGLPLALPVDRELHVMAAIREALHNVARHAQAKCVTITVTGDQAVASVAVTDDGRGLPDPVPALQQDRYRLATLRNHAEAAGGSVHASPGPAGGTRIVLSLPARPAAARR